ncbi:hypothetical protein GCM10009826_22960 [Humibacillus xanthopallidus]
MSVPVDVGWGAAVTGRETALDVGDVKSPVMEQPAAAAAVTAVAPSSDTSLRAADKGDSVPR